MHNVQCASKRRVAPTLCSGSWGRAGQWARGRAQSSTFWHTTVTWLKTVCKGFEVGKKGEMEAPNPATLKFGFVMRLRNRVERPPRQRKGLGEVRGQPPRPESP